MSGSESEDGSVISVAGVAEGGLGPVGVGGAAHLVGDLDGDLLAHGPGDLPGVLVRHLVALPVHLLLALGAAGVASVSGLSIGVPLAISVTMRDDLGVVTNNSGALVNLLGDRVAVLGDNVLALLNVGGVHNGVILLMADLPLVLDRPLVTLLVGLAEALEVGVLLVTVSGISLSLSLAVVTSLDNLGVVTNNSGALVNLLGHGVAVLGDDVLALLGVGGVHDGVVLLVAALLDLDVVLGVAVGLVIAVLELSTSISAIGNTPHAAPQDSENQDCGSEHVHDVEQNLFPSVCVNRS